MKRIFYTLFFFCAAVAIVCLRCTESTVAGGGTIETTNGIVGFIRNSDTKPASNTVVKLFPDNYDPVTDSSRNQSYIDTTDADGMYRFSHLVSGRYVVLARNCTTSANFLTRDIIVNNDSMTNVLMGTLDRPCSITADFSPGEVAGGGYLYIPGTDIYSSIRSNGSALLSDVPPGTITTVILATGDYEKRNVLRNEITVAPGDAVTIEQPLWKYSRHIGLNTTPAGADVHGDIFNFPVLIRLNSSNFDFSQASFDGRDLVFTGEGNTVFQHQIERWNAAAGHAEIWVNVDTIHGNDSAQSITMYWGNPAVPLQKERGMVFDTANSFQGVWHLGDNADDSVQDATVNEYCGISPDTARPLIAEGVIGNCRAFDGKGTYITMPNTASGKLDFPQNGQYSVSAWVMADTFIDLQQTLVSKGKYQYFLWIDSTSWQFWEFQDHTGWQASGQQATLRQWVLLTGVRDGDTQYFYVNGELTGSLSLKSDTSPRNTKSDLNLGRAHELGDNSNTDKGLCFFRGKIDEVRILSVAQSPDWVRLCYMNQRLDDRLVVYEK